MRTTIQQRRRHAAALEFIAAHLADLGRSPTIRDVADHLGVSPSTALLTVEQLHILGRLRRVPGGPTVLEIVRPPVTTADRCGALASALRLVNGDPEPTLVERLAEAIVTVGWQLVPIRAAR